MLYLYHFYRLLYHEHFCRKCLLHRYGISSINYCRDCLPLLGSIVDPVSIFSELETEGAYSIKSRNHRPWSQLLRSPKCWSSLRPFIGSGIDWFSNQRGTKMILSQWFDHFVRNANPVIERRRRELSLIPRNWHSNCDTPCFKGFSSSTGLATCQQPDGHSIWRVPIGHAKRALEDCSHFWFKKVHARLDCHSMNRPAQDLCLRWRGQTAIAPKRFRYAATLQIARNKWPITRVKWGSGLSCRSLPNRYNF